MNKQKHGEYLNLIEFLNSINLEPHKIYTYESPDFVLEDLKQELIAIELVEFFNDYNKESKDSKAKKVAIERERFRVKLQTYLDKSHSDKDLWILVEVNKDFVDYEVDDAIKTIENLLQIGLNRTDRNKTITKHLLGIQINKTGGGKSTSCFVNFVKGNEEPPRFIYESIIDIIDKKIKVKKNWKRNFSSNWLLIHLGDIAEQYTLVLEFNLNESDKIKYLEHWDRIYIYCPSRSKSIQIV